MNEEAGIRYVYDEKTSTSIKHGCRTRRRDVPSTNITKKEDQLQQDLVFRVLFTIDISCRRINRFSNICMVPDFYQQIM